MILIAQIKHLDTLNGTQKKPRSALKRTVFEKSRKTAKNRQKSTFFVKKIIQISFYLKKSSVQRSGAFQSAGVLCDVIIVS